MTTRSQRTAAIAARLPPLALAALLAATMCVAAAAFPGAAIGWPARGLLSAAPALIGFGIVVAGVAQFRRAATTVDPRAPERSSSLVTSGVYRVTRNPMYLGFALALTGWAVWLGNAVALIGPAAFVLWMNRIQIPFEEAAMESRFGAAFDAYRRRTRRWI